MEENQWKKFAGKYSQATLATEPPKYSESEQYILELNRHLTLGGPESFNQQTHLNNTSSNHNHSDFGASDFKSFNETKFTDSKFSNQTNPLFEASEQSQFRDSHFKNKKNVFNESESENLQISNEQNVYQKTNYQQSRQPLPRGISFENKTEEDIINEIIQIDGLEPGMVEEIIQSNGLAKDLNVILEDHETINETVETKYTYIDSSSKHSK